MQSVTNQGMMKHGVVNQATNNKGMSPDSGSKCMGEHFRPPPGLRAPCTMGPQPQQITFADIAAVARDKLESALACGDKVAVTDVADQLIKQLYFYAESQNNHLCRDRPFQHLTGASKAQEPWRLDAYTGLVLSETFGKEMMGRPSPDGKANGTEAFCIQMLDKVEEEDAASWPPQHNYSSHTTPRQLDEYGCSFHSESLVSTIEGAPISRESSKSFSTSASLGPCSESLVDEFGFEVPSIGSLQHHAGFCRPCDFVGRGGSCRVGVDCAYCHICGPTENRRRKRIRQKLMRGGKLGTQGHDSLDENAFWSNSSSSSADFVLEL